MKRLCRMGAHVACLMSLNLFIASAHAAAITGQGTWETTLQARDLDGDPYTTEAHYDTVLKITWLADANYALTSGFDADGVMDWTTANNWAAALDPYGSGVTGWRLPTLSPINNNFFDSSFSNNATTDMGTATTTTSGADGGWRDGSGIPTSELGHLFYVTLGNLGRCIPNGSGSTTSCDTQTGSGFVNTAEFVNIQQGRYFFDRALNASFVWEFTAGGEQRFTFPDFERYAWAVYDGDVGTSTVPVPTAAWLLGSGFLSLVGIAGRKK